MSAIINPLGPGTAIVFATSNLSWNVATTGSDSNPGTPAQPFRTIQHAANVAAQYYWANLYFPTINVALGTYNEQVLLPQLIGCPNGGVITLNGSTITDNGTDYALTTSTFATWTIPGLKTSGTFGGIHITPLSILNTTTIDLGGNNAQNLLLVDSSAVFFQSSGTTNISATAAANFVFSRGTTIMDAVTVTFANAISLGATVTLDSTMAFLGFFDSKFVNAANVTNTGGNKLIIVNGGFFESSANTQVDGAAMTRANFPGTAGVLIDQFSIFEPDAAITGNNLLLNSSNTDQTSIFFQNTSAGGKSFNFGSTGSANGFGPGLFSIFNGTDGRGILNYIYTGGQDSLTLPNSMIIGWDGVTQFGVPSLTDVAIKRNAAGLLEIDSGTPGTLRDLTLRDIFTNDAAFAFRTKTTLTNSAAAATATLTNSPAAGNPTKWFSIDDNGTTRRIPAW